MRDVPNCQQYCRGQCCSRNYDSYNQNNNKWTREAGRPGGNPEDPKSGTTYGNPRNPSGNPGGNPRNPSGNPGANHGRPNANPRNNPTNPRSNPDYPLEKPKRGNRRNARSNIRVNRGNFDVWSRLFPITKVGFPNVFRDSPRNPKG